MVYHGKRISSANDNAAAVLYAVRYLPGEVDKFRRHICQLGRPTTDINTLRVILLPLQNRVKYSNKWRRIRPSSGRPLPAAVVGRRITIDELAHEPPLANLKGKEQIFNQEGGCDHPGPIMPR